MRIRLITGSVLAFSVLRAFAQPTDVDLRINMDFRSEWLGIIPTDRPYWIEVTRTRLATEGWDFLTFPDSFGHNQFSRGTTIGFYDDLGGLLFTNRQASNTFAGSHIGLGAAYSPGFGVGSTTLPDLNRHYYLGVVGVDRDFLPNFATTNGTDSGAFGASILPGPSGLAVLLTIGLPLAARRRRDLYAPLVSRNENNFDYWFGTCLCCSESLRPTYQR